LQSAICHRAEDARHYRTRALILRPLFMMLTCPEARRSATVATVSS
jgi:hypothetical protein